MWRSAILFCVATLPLVAAEPDPKLVQAEVEKLQGLWEVTKAEDNGKIDEGLVGQRLLIVGTMWKGAMAFRLEEGTFSLNPTTKANEIDAYSALFMGEQYLVRGLYRIDAADQLTVHFALKPIVLLDGKEQKANAKANRPADFDSPSLRVTLKRLAVKGDTRDLRFSAKPSVTWKVQLAVKDVPAKLTVTGAVPNNWGVGKVPSSYLTSTEQLTAIWKELQVGGPVPEIDFADQCVIVIETVSFGHQIRPHGTDAGRFSFAMGPPRREGKQYYTIVVFPKAAVDDLLAAMKKTAK